MVVDERHVGGRDDAACEPAPVQRVHGGHRRRDGRTLAVHVALRRRLVYVHVQHAAVLVTLADHVVADLDVPMRISFPAKMYKWEFLHKKIDQAFFNVMIEYIKLN